MGEHILLLIPDLHTLFSFWFKLNDAWHVQTLHHHHHGPRHRSSAQSDWALSVSSPFVQTTWTWCPLTAHSAGCTLSLSHCGGGDGKRLWLNNALKPSSKKDWDCSLHTASARAQTESQKLEGHILDLCQSTLTRTCLIRFSDYRRVEIYNLSICVLTWLGESSQGPGLFVSIHRWWDIVLMIETSGRSGCKSSLWCSRWRW